MNAERDETYTWDDAQRDLALLTHLTLGAACALVHPLRATGVHPYDATPLLQRLVNPLSTTDVLGEALYQLLALQRNATS